VEVSPQLFVAEEIGMVLAQVFPAATRKPQVPTAGSQITSSGVGATSSTMVAMMWRGVRNWPFWPGWRSSPAYIRRHRLWCRGCPSRACRACRPPWRGAAGSDLEAGVAHVARIGRATAVECPQEWKHVLVEDAEHLARLEVFELGPAQAGIRFAALVVAVGKDAPLHRRAEPRRLSSSSSCISSRRLMKMR